MMHVNSGGIINFQEFKSLDQCKYAAQLIMQRSQNTTNGADAFCIEK